MKRIAVLLFVAFALLAACSPKGGSCIIEGELEGMPGTGTIVLEDAFTEHGIIDTFTVVDGKFYHKISLDSPALAQIYYEASRLVEFFIEPGENIRISGDYSNEGTIEARGGKLNGLWEEYEMASTELAVGEESFAVRYNKFAGLMENLLADSNDDIFKMRVILKNVHNVFPAAYTALCQIKQMDPAIQEKFNVQMCRSLLERRVEVEPQVEGSPTVPLYKDFEVIDRNGEPVKLSDVIRNGGKRYVLVDFWATWCRPCCDQFPKLKEIYASYHNKGLEVFAVSYDMDKAKWISYIKENNLEWLHGIPASDTVLNSISRDYVISGIPTNILIDCQTGVIIGRDMPMEVLESKLEELVESKN